MRITGVTTQLYRIPPAVKIEDSIHRVSHWEFLVTTLATDAGLRGTGFAYTNGCGGTAVRELVDTYIAPLVIGRDPVDIEQIWRSCWWELHSLGSGGMTRFALASVDIALWDLLAQPRRCISINCWVEPATASRRMPAPSTCISTASLCSTRCAALWGKATARSR